MATRFGLAMGGMAAAAVLAAAAGEARAGVTVLPLRDHPDAFHAPPSYGLRLDNLFLSIGGIGGFTTFSFNTFNDVVMTITDGPGMTINISGTVYGGVDTGTTYGYGEGAYSLAFTYTANVATDPLGWTVEGQSPLNNGTLTALGDNNGVPMGTVFTFADKADPTGVSFLALRDGYRMTAEQVAENGDPWVGRGWLMASQTPPGTQDFLFLAIPSPSTLLIAGALGGMLGVRRRR